MSSSYNVGTAVAIKGNLHGVIKYVGKMRGRKGIWYGIKLTSSNGTTDGMDSGRYYFYCKDKYGIFVKKKQIISIISNTKSARQSQKMAQLRKKNITLFNVYQNEEKSENKDDDEKKDIIQHKNESTQDYEASIIHQFFRFNLSVLIPYLDTNTLYNLFAIEHFTTFYDISSFWNENMLISRIIYPQNQSIYKQLQLNGIYINIWNLENAFNKIKENEYIKNQKWKIRKYRFLLFIALQHILSHKKQYEFGGYYQNKKTKKKVIKANCNELHEQFVKIYGDLSVISNDLISIKYPKNQERYYTRNPLNGSCKKFKNFKQIFDQNTKISLFRKRDGVNGMINKLEKILIIPISDLLVKQWLIFNTKQHTIICGWVSVRCIIVIFGGCRLGYYW